MLGKKRLVAILNREFGLDLRCKDCTYSRRYYGFNECLWHGSYSVSVAPGGLVIVEGLNIPRHAVSL